MLDIKYIRENKEEVIENIKKKFQEHKISSVEKLINLDEEYRENLKKANKLKNQRNILTEEVAKRKHNGQDATDVLEEVKSLPEKIKELDEILKKLQIEIWNLQITIPNIISPETPIGKDESENKEIKRFSEPKEYDFKLKGHVQIAEELGLVDFESSRNVSGKGFYFLKGDLALLNQALIRYAQDYMYKKGYICIAPPLMINRDACNIVSYEDFKESIFKIENKDLHLVASSELSLINMFKDKVIDDSKMPIKLFAFSPCFRQEIGSHGVDERGLFRVHQFDKVEQIIVCRPDESRKYFEEILLNQTEMLLELGFTLRHLEICTGDLGDMKDRMIDLEVWGPKRKGWIELGSCSNLNNAQSLKLNIKAKTKQGEKYIPHTLNNTALSTTRTLVAILENFQTEKGTIKIPEVLVSYMYGKTEIMKNENFF
jgi:seryl-tRNA synthetase